MVDHSDRKGRSSACRDVKFPSSKPKKTFHFITINVSKGQKHFSHRLFNINQCKLRYYPNHFVLESSLTKGQNLGKTKKDKKRQKKDKKTKRHPVFKPEERADITRNATI